MVSEPLIVNWPEVSDFFSDLEHPNEITAINPSAMPVANKYFVLN